MIPHDRPSSSTLPPPSLPPPAERAAQRVLQYPMRLAGFESCYVRTSFGRFHYYDSMPGSNEPPALLLHGLGALAVSLFPLAALLKRRRRIVMPDLFQFMGLSEPLWGRMAPNDHAEALLEFAHGLHAEAFDVLGHSAGGGAAVLVSLGLGQRARSLTLLNPGGFSHGFESLREDILSLEDEEGELRVYDKLGARGPFQISFVRTFGARAIGSMFRRPGVQDFLGTVRDFDFVDDRLREVRCPTLLLWGDEDRILPRDIALHIATETPDVEAYWVKGGTHMLPIDDPFTVYLHLSRFWGLETTKRGRLGRLARRLVPVRPSEPIAIARHAVRADAAE